MPNRLQLRFWKKNPSAPPSTVVRKNPVITGSRLAVQRNETDARAVTIDVEVAAQANAILADTLHRDLPRARQIRRFGGMQGNGGDLRQFPVRETSTPWQVSGHDSYATIF